MAAPLALRTHNLREPMRHGPPTAVQKARDPPLVTRVTSRGTPPDASSISKSAVPGGAPRTSVRRTGTPRFSLTTAAATASPDLNIIRSA